MDIFGKALCETCVSKDVCRYKCKFDSTEVITEHPYLELRCTKYHSVLDDMVEDMLNKSRLDFRIKTFRALNPKGTKMECHKITGISRPTIDKYWEGKAEVTYEED